MTRAGNIGLSPGAVFRQCLAVIRFGIQNTMAYRVNFFFQAAFNLIPLFTGLAVWRAIYAGGKDAVAGYTETSMLSYYLVAAVVDALTGATEDDWQIAHEIRDGRINQFLVKPFDYLTYRLCLFCSGRLVFSAASALPITAFMLLNADGLVPPPTGWLLALFVGSLLASALNQFLLTFLTATLSFWVLEISSFTFILLALQRLAGGLMFPLDVLPASLASFLRLTPFACQVFLPVQIYLGRERGIVLIQDFALQLFWVIVLYLLARLACRRGLRAHGAFGG
jgi:ABC-2 type transport system permease protein